MLAILRRRAPVTEPASPLFERPTLREWQVCATQLAAAYREMVASQYPGDAGAKVVAESRALARFRRLQEREGGR